MYRMWSHVPASDNSSSRSRDTSRASRWLKVVRQPATQSPSARTRNRTTIVAGNRLMQNALHQDGREAGAGLYANPGMRATPVHSLFRMVMTGIGGMADGKMMGRGRL